MADKTIETEMTGVAGKPDRTVAVFGSGEVVQGSDDWRLAFAVGRTLAGLGYAIANGGYAGTMEASAKGAVEAGGWAVGVTCRLWGARPNAYLSRTVVTEDLPQRIQTLIELGGAGYVVLPGATGTLAELAWVWELTFKGFLPARPIVCVGEFWRPLVEMTSLVRPAGARYVALANGPERLGHFFPKA